MQTITEKLEVETYGRAELEELQKALMQERAEIKARIDAESKNSASLIKHKRDLEQERDTKVGNMKGDIEGVERKVQAEKAAAQEWGSLIKEEEGEETVLIKKVDANKEAIQEMEMTQKRLTDILSEINTQVDAMMATIEVSFAAQMITHDDERNSFFLAASASEPQALDTKSRIHAAKHFPDLKPQTQNPESLRQNTFLTDRGCRRTLRVSAVVSRRRSTLSRARYRPSLMRSISAWVCRWNFPLKSLFPLESDSSQVDFCLSCRNVYASMRVLTKTMRLMTGSKLQPS